MSMIGCYKQISQDELGLLLGGVKTASDVVNFDGSELLNKYLGIDKSWHAIHFLLNNDAWKGSYPLHNAILGGSEIGEDLGYGPARYLTPQEAKQTSNSLSQISVEEFASRFDADKLKAAEIYPHGWQDNQQEIEYLRDNFLDLVAFFKQAASDEDAMIIWLS